MALWDAFRSTSWREVLKSPDTIPAIVLALLLIVEPILRLAAKRSANPSLPVAQREHAAAPLPTIDEAIGEKPATPQPPASPLEVRILPGLVARASPRVTAPPPPPPHNELNSGMSTRAVTSSPPPAVAAGEIDTPVSEPNEARPRLASACSLGAPGPHDDTGAPTLEAVRSAAQQVHDVLESCKPHMPSPPPLPPPSAPASASASSPQSERSSGLDTVPSPPPPTSYVTGAEAAAFPLGFGLGSFPMPMPMGMTPSMQLLGGLAPHQAGGAIGGRPTATGTSGTVVYLTAGAASHPLALQELEGTVRHVNDKFGFVRCAGHESGGVFFNTVEARDPAVPLRRGQVVRFALLPPHGPGVALCGRDIKAHSTKLKAIDLRPAEAEGAQSAAPPAAAAAAASWPACGGLTLPMQLPVPVTAQLPFFLFGPALAQPPLPPGPPPSARLPSSSGAAVPASLPPGLAGVTTAAQHAVLRLSPDSAPFVSHVSESGEVAPGGPYATPAPLLDLGPRALTSTGLPSLRSGGKGMAAFEPTPGLHRSARGDDKGGAASVGAATTLKAATPQILRSAGAPTVTSSSLAHSGTSSGAAAPAPFRGPTAAALTSVQRPRMAAGPPQQLSGQALTQGGGRELAVGFHASRGPGRGQIQAAEASQAANQAGAPTMTAGEKFALPDPPTAVPPMLPAASTSAPLGAAFESAPALEALSQLLSQNAAATGHAATVAMVSAGASSGTAAPAQLPVHPPHTAPSGLMATAPVVPVAATTAPTNGLGAGLPASLPGELLRSIRSHAAAGPVHMS